ncbi:MAG: response regulator [Alphaproteobacteria bacterium]|nr:response regulator [Alphaproteobacteria bacterium]
MSRILVVDDEAAIQRLVSAVLARGGHAAVAAATGRAALAEFERAAPDAAIVDLGLPDRDGLELIAALRSRSTVPILVLSARDATAEKIAALDLGADDYVTKPFDGDELLARLRAALRRTAARTAGEAILGHGGIAVDRSRHRVTSEGREIALTPREFAVLEALVEAGGRVLTHAALLEQVWGRAHLNDVEYLRVVIRALRLKLEADPSQPRLIRNEPGIGYRLAD